MNNILFLDIDDTLLIPQNIYIYYQKDDKNIKYTPHEYSLINVSKEDKKYYNYVDFRDHYKIKKSIETSIPIEKTLEIVNFFVSKDYELGILTARGQEDLIGEIIPIWLKKYLNYDFILKRENIYAVNDKNIKYEGITDSQKKLNVLNKYKKYDNIYYIDDNIHTINLIKKNNKKVETIFVDW